MISKKQIRKILKAQERFYIAMWSHGLSKDDITQDDLVDELHEVVNTEERLNKNKKEVKKC